MSELQFHLKSWLKQSKHTRSPWGEKLDSNGYSETLLPSGDSCFLCARGGDLARHEVYGGADRQTSKATGMWVQLCPECHQKVHENGIIADSLKALAQMEFELYHTHEEFLILFGENYR